jgi:hypothetical protein
MAVGLTQPLTEMSTRNISWEGRGSWYVGLTTLPPSCANCHEIWEPQSPGTPRAFPGLHREFFYLTAHITNVTDALLHDGKQCSACHCSDNLAWGQHVLVNVLHLVLDF